MATREVVVAAAEGLHARPAANFVQAAKNLGTAVTIAKGGKTVSAASILQVLSLGAHHGDQVTLSAEGEGADEALDTLATLLENPDA